MMEKGLFLPIPRGKYRRTEHSVGHPVFDLRVYQLFSPFGLLRASTVLSSLWPVGQRLMMLCNPTDVCLSKEASKRSLETYFLPSLEAVAESLNWSMTLCSDALMEEVQSRIKDVLWEVDRVGYKCNVNLQWDGTEDSQSTVSFCEMCDLPQGTAGSLSSFIQTVYEPIRILSGRTRSAAASAWNAACGRALK